MSDKFDVFISHSTRDSEWTRKLVKSLKDQGVVVWVGREQVKPGTNVASAIQLGLKKSAHVVTILDAARTPPANVFFEAGAAIGMGKKVTFVVPKDHELKQHLGIASVVKRATPTATAKQIVRSLKVGD
jgi:hypothetical protein